jgi:hypothetical protein
MHLGTAVYVLLSDYIDTYGVDSAIVEVFGRAEAGECHMEVTGDT